MSTAVPHEGHLSGTPMIPSGTSSIPTLLSTRGCVILCRTEGPINLGQISRSMANIGIRELRLVNPLCEVNHSDSRKFAHHSRDLLFNAKVFNSMEEAVSDLSCVIATSARHHSATKLAGPEFIPSYLSIRYPESTEKFGIVFGNEADGLTGEELSWAQAYVHIPTYGTYHSYNLATAVSITLYTVQRVSMMEEHQGIYNEILKKSMIEQGHAIIPATTHKSQTIDSVTSSMQSMSVSSSSSTTSDASSTTTAEQSTTQESQQADMEALADGLPLDFDVTQIQTTGFVDVDNERGISQNLTAEELQVREQIRAQSKAERDKRREVEHSGVCRKRNHNLPASRSHVKSLAQYWIGTAERLGIFENLDQREKFVKVMTKMCNDLPFTYKHVNVIQGMFAHVNKIIFGDKALSMTVSGRAPTRTQYMHYDALQSNTPSTTVPTDIDDKIDLQDDE